MKPNKATRHNNCRKFIPSPARIGVESRQTGARGALRDNGESGARPACVLDMEMSSLRSASKDGINHDGLVKRNGGDSTQVTVPLESRVTPCDGRNILRQRRLLLDGRKRLCAMALFTAIFGILLMICRAELCHYLPGSRSVFIINCSITLSTGCLLILIIAFHYKDIRLFTIDNNQADWHIAMTTRKFFGIILELIVCAIHPVGTYGEMGLPVNSSFSSPLCVSRSHGDALMGIELLLSVLMFLRLYLVQRTVMLHNKVLLSASYRTIGSLNRINFSFRFVVKTMIHQYPARMLLGFIICYWLTVSWMFTLCERQSHATASHMGKALWLIPITFLTVGYGDVTPITACGKTVCVITGVMGVVSTAMLVAVVSKKLEMNKGEKHVHFFMMDNKLCKKIQHAAANVLRECWLLHRTNVKGNRGEQRKHQKYLLNAIKVFRYLRLKRQRRRDSANEAVALPTMHMIMCDRLLSIEQRLQQISEVLSQVVHQLNPEIR
ncbi:intermediate conductance calcium-activated potassium channel protein 4 isoform X2 [Myripristis murdjan]|uniref:intermediate conductance calcium-activated potassium channel protein 4 isoform X2 n=1 Tax=Myripristis murdjan TaxID=586833 RepID=UPI001175DB64|nr:intermediate conductance calcium-activated potassium channel protein 4 isoform X2 [Myripristis murdjan]